MTDLSTEFHYKNSLIPLFEVGPAGHVQLNPSMIGTVSDFCEAVKMEVGANPTVRCWPYRAGCTTCIAFDVTGDEGDLSLTIIEGDVTEITVRECSVIDAVDAFYLISALLDALGLPAASGGVALFGGRMIAK